MLIRMLVDLSGPNLLLAPGDEHEFPQDEALRLVAAGYGVPVIETKIELAVRPQAPEIREARSDVMSLPNRHRHQGRRR